jgi:hypothetical protein
MRLLFSSLLLGLAWFAAINMIMSVAVWAIARVFLNRERHIGPRNPSVMLALRLLPVVAALVFLVLFLSSHWRFEPPNSGERFGVVLGSLAALSLVLLARSVWRAGRLYRVGRHFRRHTQNGAAVPGLDALEVEGVSGVSLAGVFRPRIVVGPQARAALTAAELEVAVAHEVAHERSHDNLKAFAMFCAPDFFGWSDTARRLEVGWRAGAECSADAEAVCGEERRALALATALVKVARLGEPASAPLRSPVWSSFHEPGLLEVRVRRLLQSRHVIGMKGMMGWAPASLRALFAVVAIGVVSGEWLSGGHSLVLHHLTETLVILLP